MKISVIGGHREPYPYIDLLTALCSFGRDAMHVYVSKQYRLSDIAHGAETWLVFGVIAHR